MPFWAKIARRKRVFQRRADRLKEMAVRQANESIVIPTQDRSPECTMSVQQVQLKLFWL